VVDIRFVGNTAAVLTSDGKVYLLDQVPAKGLKLKEHESFQPLSLNHGIWIRQAQNLSSKRVTQLDAGIYHFLALTSEGEIYAWGCNGLGQLGKSEPHIEIPAVITALQGMNVVKISAGPFHSLALTDQGEVYGWGDNRFGALGLDFKKYPRVNQPQPLRDLSGRSVISLHSGWVGSFAITSEGKVYTWGRNAYEVLKMSDDEGSFPPVEVPLLIGKKVIDVSSSQSGGHALILTREGEVYGFGTNRFGELGDGTLSPDPGVTRAKGLPPVKSIQAGKCFSAAVDVSGATYWWGLNRFDSCALNFVKDGWVIPAKVVLFVKKSSRSIDEIL
jgi:alpha-tubulin suppressor-like RCC1 family protein